MFWDGTREAVVVQDLATAPSTDLSLEYEMFDQDCIGNDEDNWAANDHFLSTFWFAFDNFEDFDEGTFR